MQTIQTVRAIRRKHKQASQCPGSKKEPEQFRSTRTPADGFLRHYFLPLFQKGKKLPDQLQVENDFFNSLAILTKLYSFETIEVTNKFYPYNILLVYADIQKQFSQSVQDIELKIIQDDDGTVKLATQHCYNTDNTLYYIPVLPLYKLLKNSKHKQTAELLLSVFAYLYHIAGIPYYREDSSYLYYHYECMEEWILEDLQDEESEGGNSMVSELNKAVYYGEIMLRKIYNPYHLNCFKKRVDNYKPSSPFEKDCLNVGKQAFELLRRYPSDTIFRNTSNEVFESEEGIIRAEQYISFIADTDGILYKNIQRVINDEFNECSEIEEPTLLQIYDSQNELTHKALDFECRLFPLLNDLCTLLNNMP
ncbi:hypothetical protein B0A67_13240 [Flavobacterium aquidurense]|uniref:hypothetical protein n=1 Tax=Flavobacterium aquidurense TaxID=362413 RepID=UPI00091EEA7C|nr:hypothetical protein [Flavobacterium aquidurense]OXA71222.1 hypothetical protein B0A67_13240 [Flavobacterium aquidurense]SHG68817.1 hypothetical protein SAMN05444481_106198 [Flavobacterium frigidimaris]